MTAADVATSLSGSFARLRDVAGVSITDSRAAETVGLVAVIGSTTYAEQSGAGYVETAESRDFMILAADLKFGNQAVRPERGDVVTEVVDGVEQKYPVVAPGGDRFYSCSDPYRAVMRVHCMRGE